MRTTLALSLCLAFAGCGGESPTEGEGTSGGEANYEGPVASTDTALGDAQYQRYCNGCHPGGAEGRGPAIRDLADPPAEVRRQIREGGDDMPGFGADRIDATQLEALLAYLQTMGTVAADAPVTDPVVEGPTVGEDAALEP